MEKLSAKIFRYDPTTDDSHRYETFEVPCEKGMRVLDVLMYIQENFDTSLAFRYSCRRARCGSCAVVVNGKPEPACLGEAKKNMVIEPLPNLPIIRDLVVRTDEYEERIQDINPYLVRTKQPELKPEKLLSSDFTQVMPLNECIECFSCVSACPVNGIKWKGFLGPTTLVQLSRRLLDPRDDRDRIQDALRTGFENCVSCYMCVNTCPVEIGILDGAIENIKKNYIEKRQQDDYSKYNNAWKNIVIKNGIVNPFILMRRILKINTLLKNIVTGIKFFLKGRISLSSKRIPNIEEIRKIEKVIGEKR